MEPRDPSPPSPGDEESLSATAALAKEAAVLFQNRRFSDCVDVLKQLLQKKEDDPKVLHNIAVSEYFSENSSDPQKLLGILEKTKEKCDELARISKEKGDSTSEAGASAKGSSILLNQISASSGGLIAYGDESDTTIPNLNTALVLYHLHEYPSALAILEKLYEAIDDIDEMTALNVCFLLLDIAFTIQDAKRAADVIQYLEKSFGINAVTNQTDNGTVVQPQPINPPKPPVKNVSAPSDTSSDLSALHNATSMDDTAQGRNLTDEEYENLYSTLDTGKLFLTDHFSKTPTDLLSIATHADLKVKLQLFKVRLLLLTRNLKVAKRELKLAMNMARGRDSSTELLLKSQLEYARGNHRKAVKLLSLPPGNRTDPATAAMFYNNLGCILHQQGSYHAANMLFCKALKESSVLHSKPLKLNLFSQDKSLLVSYNLGLQHLISGKPLLAARCFRESVPFFGTRPLFWLRFAECSLLALEMGLLTEPSYWKEGITVNVAGSGKWRHLVVNGCEGRREKIDGLELISLPRAREYLVNAMLLMQVAESEQKHAALPDDVVSDQSQAKASGQKNTSGGTDPKVPTPTTASVQASSVNGVVSWGSNLNATLVSSVAAYAKICKKENLKIKQAVFADLAYVDLCLKNPLRAWKFARSLIELPDCSKKYLFLGHVYAAEALCLLNRLKEATELLSIYMEGANSVVLPFSDEDESESWFLDREKEKDGDGDEAVVDAVGTKQMSESKQFSSSNLKPEEARAMLYVNLSVVSAMQGEVEQAAAFVKQAFNSLPENPRVVLASVYIDLLKGNSVDALTKLRQCRNVRFQSSGSTAV